MLLLSYSVKRMASFSSVHLCVCPYKILYVHFYGVPSFRYLLMSCNNPDFCACHYVVSLLSFMPTLALNYEKGCRNSDLGITLCLVHRYCVYFFKVKTLTNSATRYSG